MIYFYYIIVFHYSMFAAETLTYIFCLSPRFYIFQGYTKILPLIVNYTSSKWQIYFLRTSFCDAFERFFSNFSLVQSRLCSFRSRQPTPGDPVGNGRLPTCVQLTSSRALVTSPSASFRQTLLTSQPVSWRSTHQCLWWQTCNRCGDEWPATSLHSSSIRSNSACRALLGNDPPAEYVSFTYSQLAIQMQ